MVRKFIYYLFHNNAVGIKARIKIVKYLPSTKDFNMVTKFIIKLNSIQTRNRLYLTNSGY